MVSKPTRAKPDVTSQYPQSSKSLVAVSLDEILNAAEPELAFIVPGLIPKGGNVIVRVAPEVDPLMYVSILLYSTAAGHKLQPFGQCPPTVNFGVFGRKTPKRLREQLEMLHSRGCQSDERRGLAARNLHLSKLEFGGNKTGYLNWITTQESLEDSMPDECELIVYFDAAYALTTRDADAMDYRKFADHLGKLNQKGIATVVFFQAGKRSCDALEDEFMSDGVNCFLTLTCDPGAPRDLGGGFIVERRKMSEHDTLPMRFAFWYTVIDGSLDFGWECRDSAITENTKKFQIFERQKRVQGLLDQEMPQKEIAVVLNVDAATVSRDVATIKAAGRG